MKHINLSLLKPAIGAIVSIYIAQIFQFEYPISAGIVAILTIAQTKKETIYSAIHRFYAFVIALVIAYFCYQLLGYHVYSFFIYLLLYTVVCQLLHYGSSISVNSVLISHFLTSSPMNSDTIQNEVGLFLIGTLLGIIMNLHLRKDTVYIEKLKQDSDNLIKQALHDMSVYIIDPSHNVLQKEFFDKLNQSIHLAKSIALENTMNQLFKNDRHDQEYIGMRESQVYVLANMHKRIQQIEVETIHAHKISKLLESISSSFHADNCSTDLFDELLELFKIMESTSLPSTRKEFETRAHLFILLKDIEELLLIKNQFCKISK